jgi:hypothetical protein
MQPPKRPTAPQLARVGITIVRRTPLTVRCERCGAEWRAEGLETARTLRRDYWKCRNSCNTTMAQSSGSAEGDERERS